MVCIDEATNANKMKTSGNNPVIKNGNRNDIKNYITIFIM